MNSPRFVTLVLAAVAAAALAVGGYLTSETWLSWLPHARKGETASLEGASAETNSPSEKVIVSDQAQKNLGLTARRLRAETFWKTIQVPGMVVDRPGQTDRGVSAPAAGVIAKVFHFPGETVRPGEALFTLKLMSEPLHQTQTSLFKSAQEITLAQAQRKRLIDSGGAVPQSRIIEVEGQMLRLEASIKADRLELLNRGLTADQIAGVVEGRYVSEIPIVVPARPTDSKPLVGSAGNPALAASAALLPAFEVQELKADLGQQVQAGQTLCLLANHQALAIEGRAFPDETPLLERTVKEKWQVEVDFQEDAGTDWPELRQSFRISHLANNIDPVNRTFAFLMPLGNQSRTIEEQGRTQMLWRFRPGQKVRVLVRVAKFDNVFVLPADAVAREGAEAFVFTQNVNRFERKGVHVLLQDRNRVVIANDGSLPTYLKDREGARSDPKEKDVWTIPAIAQTAAAQLNRMAKAGSSAIPKGYHVHADGTLHKNEDEGK